MVEPQRDWIAPTWSLYPAASYAGHDTISCSPRTSRDIYDSSTCSTHSIFNRPPQHLIFIFPQQMYNGPAIYSVTSSPVQHRLHPPSFTQWLLRTLVNDSSLSGKSIWTPFPIFLVSVEILYKTIMPPGNKGGGVIGTRAVKDTRRTWPTQTTKQGP